MASHLRLISYWAGACMVLTSVSGLFAQEEMSWDNPSGGLFGDAGNWDNAVPQPGDLGWFNLQQSGYTVELDGSYSIGALQIADDQVLLDLNEWTLDLTNPTTVTDSVFGTTSLMIGRGLDSTPHNGALTVSGGGTLNLVGMTIGGTAGSSGTLIVDGSDTVLNIGGSGGNNAILGYQGEGKMYVRNGATVDFGSNFTMGRHAGSTAELRFQDEGTTASFTWINVGLRSTSNLYVENGATLIGGSGTDGRLDIAARTLDSAMTVDGATVHAGNVQVSFWTSTGTLEVLNGGTMEISGYLRASTDASGRSTGIITVDGANSQLSVSSFIQLGGTTSELNNTAALSVSNGGELSAEGIIYAWKNSTIAIDGGTISAAQLRGAEEATLDITLHSAQFSPLFTVTGSDATIIDGMHLNLFLSDGFTAVVDDVFVLLDYEALTGTFFGLADGATIERDGYAFELSYGSGTVDSVRLAVTAIPEPSTVAIVCAIVAAGMIAMRRKVRARS